MTLAKFRKWLKRFTATPITIVDGRDGDKLLYFPSYYTAAEGGTFIPWTRGPVTAGQLARVTPRSRVQMFNGVTVHSFLFFPQGSDLDPTIERIRKHDHPRWDTWSGWTTEARP